MTLADLKNYLINIFPTTSLGSRVVDLFYYCVRNCKKRDYIFVENLKKNSFDIISVLIVKDEARYIKEWIEYHRIIGIDHFVIYDNESTDGIQGLLEGYIQEGLVSYTFVKGAKQQTTCYEDAVARYRDKTNWMTFTDADEFIFLHDSMSLPLFLESYRDYAGIGINWNMFDSNGFESCPDKGFVISNYIRCLQNRDDIPENRHIKTIVNPKFVHHFSNPHLPVLFFSSSLLKRRCIVTENFKKISCPLTSVNSTSKIQINHYFSKSKEEYVKKISRGRADNGVIRAPRKEDYDFSNLKTACIKMPPIIISKLEKTIEGTYE